MNKVQQIIQAVILNRGVAIDDHTNKECTITSFSTFVSHNGTEHVVPVSRDFFSITPLAVDKEGKVHLTTFSVAGSVDAAKSDLLQALVDYNRKDNRCHFVDLHELQADGSVTVKLVPTKGS